MRRFLVTLGFTAIVACSLVAFAQQPKPAPGAAMPMSAHEYEEVMEKIDPIFDNIRKNVEGQVKTDAIAADAKKLPPLLKQAEAFWVQLKRADAIDFAKKTQAAAQNLEKTAATGDAAKTTAVVKALGLACRGCHNEYREKAPDGSYRMKKLG